MVPNGWEVKSFEDVAFVGNGQVDPREEPYSSMWHIGPENVTSDTGRIKNVRQCSELGLISGKYEFDRESIVYSKIRPNLNKVCRPDFDGVCSADMYPIWTKEGLFADYLFYYMLGPKFYSTAVSMSMRTGMPKINRTDLDTIKINIPPLPEQQKIAKILSTWDKAISTTERLIENSTQQKKALMQQLLTGKKRLLDESGKRFESEWKGVTLGKCINHTGGTALEKHVKDGASHHFISIGNYSVDGRYIDKGQRIELNDKTKTKLLDKNDLVMVLNDKTKTGDIIGSTILIDEDNKYIYNQRSERIVCSESIDVLFFWFLLNSTPVRADVFGRSQGGTQIYVNFGALKSIVLYLPPFEEQQKIATVLTNADKEIELLAQQLADLQQEKKALMQVLLTGKKRVKLND